MKLQNSILKFLPYISLILMFIAHVNNSDILICFAFLMLLLLIVFQNINDNLITLYICLPFFNIINFTPGSTSFFYVLLVIFILKNFILNWKKIVKSDAWIVYIIIILLTVYNLFDINSIISTYIPWIFMFLFYIIALNIKNVNLKKIIVNYAFSYLIASGLAKFALDHNYMQFFHVNLGYVYKDGNINYRFVGLMGETNSFAQVSLILIALLNGLYFQTNKINEKIKYLFLIIMLIIFSFLTVSKMFILGLGVIIFSISLNAIINLFTKKRLNTLYSFITILILSVIGGICFVNLQKIFQLEVVQDYLIRFSAKDLSTGRFDVYNHFLEILIQNPLNIFFGMGFKAYNIPWMLSNGMTGIHAHNLILEYICLFGVISLIIILIYFGNIFFTGIKKNKNIISFIPLLILVITGLSLHGLQTNYFYFCLFLIVKNITD